LQDSEFNFIRAVPYKPGAQTPSAIAAVLRVTQDQKQVQIHHNLPDLVKKGGMFDLLRSGAPAGKVRITAANDREATGEVTDGKAAPGDILALSGKMMPQQKMNLPSKQEVLDKVKRGEYVPREILIQVLEKP
ncbi:MAG: hypothetical protein HY042_08095, partial [Spirochaetia bacterium]|nr:hypothetical protein [Spirochaetia bacterium]